jgi:hypothetical protein
VSTAKNSRISRVFSAFVPCLVVALALAAGGCDKKGGLRITGLDPKVGPSNGGTLVTVHGSGFQDGGVKGVKVYFGDKEATRVYIDGDEAMKVEPPPGEVGQTVDVLFLFDDARKLEYPKAYTYQDFSQNNARDSLLKEKAGDAPPAAPK